jgi:hypothetical protein
MIVRGRNPAMTACLENATRWRKPFQESNLTLISDPQKEFQE